MGFLSRQRRHADAVEEQHVKGTWFLGPMEIAGYFARLRLGLETIGVSTMYVDLTDHPFSYDEAPPPNLIVRLGRVAARRASSSASRPQRSSWRTIHAGARATLFLWAIVRCDVFVFGYGHTLLGLRELPLLRLLGKRIVVVFFGSDVRPSYLDGVEANQSDASPGGLVATTRTKRNRIRRMERYAHAIVSHGPASQLLRRAYVRWMAIGIPTLSREATQDERRANVRVLHAPSHASAKGTALIRESVRILKADGLKIEYAEVSNAANAVVRQLIEQADIVVDQLYADTPMAVLASEASAAGKPVVVGSLDWGSIMTEVDAASEPPTVRCAPEELTDALRMLVESRVTREHIGHRAQQFVREQWSPEAVARRYLAVAAGTAPSEWFRSPRTIRYIGGSGLARGQLRDLLQAMPRTGPDPFLVNDKPELELRLLTGNVEEMDGDADGHA